MITASLIFNIALVVFFVIACIVFFRPYFSDKDTARHQLRLAVRFFTVDSNIFGTVASIALVIADISVLTGGTDAVPFGLILLKMTATVSLMLTFFTVVCYLLPRFGMTDLFRGANFYMHVVTPLLALFSFIFFEGPHSIPTGWFLLSLLPVFVYGLWYLWKVVLCPPQKRWPDIYMFNAHGKWYLIIFLMLAVTAVIGLLLTLLHNLILA